jgi:xylulokinase
VKILGLDIGTQGVRGIVYDEYGNIAAENNCSFAHFSISENKEYKEQNPSDLLHAAYRVIADCVRQLKGEKIDAAAIDGTSGTIVALDHEKRPLTMGIMYNDDRSISQAAKVNHAAGGSLGKLGYTFNSSYALPKILWIKENMPDIYEKTWKFIHQSDYIYGKLTGVYDITDYSNALKTGYDLLDERWPDFLAALDIDKEKLPAVTAPGTRIGTVLSGVAGETGLMEDVVFYTGTTDGCASSLAAGLSVPGEWATVIGTTMVFKGITRELVPDSQGRIYSHKHPQGWWMPGGASNVGGSCLNEMFGKENLKEYDRTVWDYLPTGDIAYPLTGTGERFPFIKPGVQGFYIGDPSNIRKKYAAIMESVAYTERLSYDTLCGLGCDIGDVVLTSGGATKAPVWVQIRANILQKQLCVPESANAAMGSAIIALSGISGSNLSDAVRSMVRFTAKIDPEIQLKELYDEIYARFREECKKRFQI